MTNNYADLNTRQREVLGQKAYDLIVGQKNDPASVGSYGPYQYGNTGLFAVPGQDQRIFSAVMMPTGALTDTLPVFNGGTAAPEGFGGMDVPLFTTVTGVTKGESEVRANQRATPCGDAPLAGLVKACTQTAPYGLFSGRIRLDIHKVGHILNGGEPTDLRLMNNPAQNNAFAPSLFAGAGTAFFTELGKKIFEAGVSYRRYLSSIIYDMTPTNNNAGGGYKEPIGVDLWINTGKVDIYGTACPRMDSIIYNFGSALVSTASANIVHYIDQIVREITWRSRKMGMGIPTIKMRMAPDLFDEIVRYWPVQYFTEALTQISAFSNGRVTFNASETATMRDNMRNGQFLPVRGKMIPVELDESILESTAGMPAGAYKSDIYFMTERSLDGTIASWNWEYFNQANGQARAVESLLGGQTWTSDGGMFRWYMNHRNGCFELTYESEIRLLSLTPYLDARLQNVGYAPLKHLDSPYPDSGYFYNGGRTNTNEQKWYTAWSTSTPVSIGGR